MEYTFVTSEKKYDGTLTFDLSKRGYSYLLENIPDGLDVSVVRKFGLPYFLLRHKRRIVLIIFPLIFILLAMFFSSFVLKIEISGGDKLLKKETLAALRENGVYRGALKRKIDQIDVKYKTIQSVEKLSWMWVDIKGVTAFVEIRPRTPVPDMYEINEPGDVISTDSGVIEKMEVYCGKPLISNGMTVQKGDLLVTGVISTEKENVPDYYHHARAKIFLRTWKEKTFIVPKKLQKKTPTGKTKSVFSVKIKKNNINFSLNSRIPYVEYDKIIKKIDLPYLPLSFFRTIYREVIVTETANHTENAINKCIADFENELESKNYDVVLCTQKTIDCSDNIKLIVTAECIVDAAKEIPIYPADKGEENG